jgi:hypothetical protein
MRTSLILAVPNEAFDNVREMAFSAVAGLCRHNTELYGQAGRRAGMTFPVSHAARAGNGMPVRSARGNLRPLRH